jgi:cell division protein FtsI (penicillin-binding protein 3)
MARQLRSSRPTPERRSGSGRAVRPHRSGERILRDGTVVRTERRRTRSARSARRRRAPVRLPLASAPQRLHVMLIVVAVAFSLCAGRLLQLQGFDSAAYAAESTRELTRTLPLLPARGELTDRNGRVLASTEPAVAVTADPKLTVLQAPLLASILSGYLQMSEAELMPLLTKPNSRFVYLKKKVPALTYSALATDLNRRKIPGIFRESDPIRSYPGGAVGSSIIGFVGSDGKGLAGVELALNDQLAGVEGKETYEGAPNGSRIPLGQSSITPAVNGHNFQLTIDSELQWAAERRLAQQVRIKKADSGMAIVMNVKTGEVLAMANAPTYDAANPRAAKAEDRGNRAISAPFEPGSVQKVLTAAALTDSGVATPTTKLVIPPRLPSGGGSIKDAFSHDSPKLHLNFRGVLARSSNIGAILLARQMKKPDLAEHLRDFGLGTKTGIELPGESAGIVPGPDMTDSQRDQIAFGQALAVTGIQEAAAIAGIINDGVYHPPTVVLGATDGQGRPVPVDRRPDRRVISSKSSAQVRDMMGAVIDAPNGRNLLLDAYQTGGKTGTAQRADTKCGCYKGYVTSYVGYAPRDDPQLLTYVVITNPRKGDTGTSVANPVYRDLMNIALPRYSVPPNPKKPVPLPIEW